MPFVYSTLTCDNVYADYVRAGDQQSIGQSVLIKGGHGVMNKNFMTPLGVETEVTDEELAFLERNDAFKFHKANDFLRVEQKSFNPERVAADMALRDGSAQIVPSDYEKGGRMEATGSKAPKTKS